MQYIAHLTISSTVSPINNHTHEFSFLPGGGEMGNLIRAKDWTATSIGPPSQWPQCLRTAVSIILPSRFPMFIWWGPDLICFYNDAYRPSLGKEGKHPDILGMRAQDAWIEIWPVIQPLIAQVLAGNGAVYSEDQLIPIYRNGQLEDVYWTFSYSAINDESGVPTGVLVTCVETTEKVKSMRALEDSRNEFRYAIEATELATFDYDPKTDLFRGNDLLKSWFGLRPDEEMLLDNAIAIIAANDQVKVKDAIRYALDPVSGGFYDIEYSIIHPQTNRTRLLHAKGRAWFGQDNKAYRFTGTVQDISQQSAAQKRLKEHQERLEIVIEASELGTWELDLTSDAMQYSDRYVQILGQATLPNGGMHAASLARVHPEDRHLRDSAFQEGLTTGNLHYESRIIWPDESIHWIGVRGKVFYDDAGAPVRLVGTIQDITQDKNFQQELQALDTQKDFFIAMASHELKTPVTTIKGYIQLLMKLNEQKSDHFARNALQVVDKQVVVLTNLISDLLDLSKIKSGALSLQKEYFDLGEFTSVLLDDFKNVYPTYSCTYEGNGQLPVFADKERITQVLNNLLTNAVKYSPGENNIIVSVFEQAQQAVVTVRDFGIGIEPKDREKIFERFYRLEGKNQRTYPGFGIGLFIASDIVQRHGGRIWVDGAPGKGSAFSFSIPLHPDFSSVNT